MTDPKSDDLAAILQQGAPKPVRRWLVAILLLALVGGGVWYLRTNKKEAELAPSYVTEPVEKDRISLVVTATGNLEPTNIIIIGSELSGIVREIYVDTNDQVKKGQRVLLLDTTKLQQQTERSRASLEAAQARVQQSQATLAESQAALARQEELHKLSKGKTPSLATMEASRAAVARSTADLAASKANVSAAEAEIRAFEADLDKAYIESPVDGVVLSRSIEIGQTVAASFTAPTLFLIAEDLRKMDLVVSISEADIGRVKVGQPASFTVDAWPDHKFSAVVKKVNFGSENINTNTGVTDPSAGGVVSYRTELSVDNPDLLLRPGMTAVADISIIDKDDILVVPNAALRFDPEFAKSIGKKEKTDNTLVQNLQPAPFWRRRAKRKPGSADGVPRVWTLQGGEPVEVQVETGITNGRVTEITKGPLTPGTPVITSLQPPKTS